MPKKTIKAGNLTVKYDPRRHCGVQYTREGAKVRCTALKGQGIPGSEGHGPCSIHVGISPESPRYPVMNYYSKHKKGRLRAILETLHSSSNQPYDILQELELLRGMLIIFIEDNSEMDKPDVIFQASELTSKVIKAAQALQQVQQAETLHVRSVKLLEIQMAKAMVETIRAVRIDVSDWREKLISQIRDRWGTISIEQDPKKISEEDLRG